MLLFLILATMHAPVYRWADAGTYYMQIQSISNDFDIRYESQDINRALEDNFSPAGMFLIKTDDGEYYYGKEFTFAMFAVPFYKLFGINGVLLLNGLMFFSMILIGYRYLQKQNEDKIALAISALYFFLSAAFVYIFWLHAEIYNMFLLMSGMFLWITYFRSNDPKYLFISSFIFGIAVAAKVPNMIFFVPLFFYELYSKRYHTASLMAIVFALPLVVVYGYFFMHAETFSFYGGNRLYYAQNFPFVGGYDSVNEIGRSLFSVSQSNIDALINTNNIKIIPYNLFYYFFGSFTGMFWYYPFVLLSAIPVLKFAYHKTKSNTNSSNRYSSSSSNNNNNNNNSNNNNNNNNNANIGNFSTKTSEIKDYINSNTDKILIATGIVLYILFFAIIVGYNYWGGTHAVGNRYFYVYPLFLFLIPKVNLKQLLLVTLLAGVTLNPVILDPIGNSANPSIHQTSFPYSYLPIEYTQLNYLPFWERDHITGDLKVYAVDENSKLSENVFMINGSTNLLLRSENKTDVISIVIGAQDKDTPVSLKLGKKEYDMDLKEDEVNYLVLTEMKPVYNDKKSYVYKLSVSSPEKVWIRISDSNIETASNPVLFLRNWYKIEDWDGMPTRWTSNNATIAIYSPENMNTSLNFRAISYGRSVNLEMYTNGLLEHGVNVSSTTFSDVQTTLHLEKGMNVVRFYVPEGYLRPQDVENSVDDRYMSVAFQNITFGSPSMAT